MNMTTVVIITFILSTIFLVYRFTNRNIIIGGSQAARNAVDKIQQGAFILDVRSSGEYAAGSYPGSVNIPVDQVASKLNLIPRDKPIVVYCAAGGRSASARDILIRNGYEDVTNAGGLGDLIQAKNSLQ